MLKLEQLESRDVPSRVWYVAPNGTGDGSLAHPAGTVAAVEWQAEAGDEIHLRAGTYALTQSVALWAPGVALKAAPGETVVLDASQLPAGTTQAVAVTGNGVVVEGLQIVGSPRTGIAVWGASGVTLRNNTIRDSQGSGIYVGFDHAGVVKGVVVEGNTIQHNSLANAALTAEEGWAAALAAQYTSGIQIRNNTVDHNFGEGIDIVLSDGAQVRGNTAFDNFSANYYLDNATNTIVDGNLSYT
ncbi:MAG: right-handed parallel beta-helix repeat-containing protein, partial [Sphingobium sp.]